MPPSASAVLEPAAVGALVRWTDTPAGKRDFIHLTADRLLRTQLGLSLQSGIQVYPTNYYNGAVHRLVQVAVNLLDTMDNALTNRLGTATNAPYLPSVYRPVYTNATVSGTNTIFITGFEDATSTNALTRPWRDPGQRDRHGADVHWPRGGQYLRDPVGGRSAQGLAQLQRVQLRTEFARHTPTSGHQAQLRRPIRAVIRNRNLQPPRL